MSTSSQALSWCAQAALDHDALAVRAFLSFHLGSGTPFAGVAVVPGGTVCALAGGIVQRAEYAARELPGLARPGSLPDLARSTARLLRAQVSAGLEDNPGLTLQLSGGLDSRVGLAAIPPAQRRAARPDAACARGAGRPRRPPAGSRVPAGSSGAQPGRPGRPPARRGVAAGPGAARRHDCSGDAAAQAALDWSDRQSWPGPRIHGIGGELCRGFYYLGQRQHPAATPELVDRLAGWRMGLDAVDLGCLGPDGAAWARECARGQLREVVSGYRGDWLTVLDEFYVRQRTPRQAGLRLTVAASERPLLGPLLGPEFVARARACPVEGKRNSRFMAMVLMELDPAAAAGGPVLVQPLLGGTGEGIFGLAVSGSATALSAHRRIRMMNPRGSGSSACRSIPVPADVTGPVRELIAASGWHGLFMVELLRDAAGQPWFMELNGRAWAAWPWPGTAATVTPAGPCAPRSTPGSGPRRRPGCRT